MFQKDAKPLFHILDESPFFIELSMKERESIVRELLKTYPELLFNSGDDPEIGYETDWFREKTL